MPIQPWRRAAGAMTRTLMLAVAASLALPTLTHAEEGDWTLAFEDDFDRAALGPDWTVLRGDWHINDAKQLQIQRQWASHSFITANVPLRGKNVRVSFDVTVPGGEQRGDFGAFLQAGDLAWGGGGIDDRVGVEFTAYVDGEIHFGEGPWLFAALPHRIDMQLIDGQYRIQLDGHTVAEGEVPQGRSLINHGLQFTALRGAMIDNLRIETQPMATPLPRLNANAPEENRRATIDAADYIDPAKPDVGFQDAIDALPPGGGVVILPAGEFTLRRFLDLPSHTTLVGQGPGTVLRLPDIEAWPVESISSDAGVHKVVMAGEHGFKAGDAFSYQDRWGHPINAGHPGEGGTGHMLGGSSGPENRLLVLAVEGNTLTVNAAPPADKKVTRLVRFFPHLCSYQSEYVSVKDLTLLGPENNSADVTGRFMVSPITFGVTAYARIERVVIRNFPADGISAQGAGDIFLLDNTIEGTHQALHPGTTTQRVMAARNLAVDNGSGQFFCWYNSNGVYTRNRLRNYTGYPDAGDAFNVIAFNHLTEDMAITVGFNGTLFNNHIPRLTVYQTRGNRAQSPDVLGPGGRTYDNPPRYFNIARNTIDELNVYRYARGNVFAHNVTAGGQPTPITWRISADETDPDPELAYNLHTSDAPSAIEGLPQPITRTEPVPPPALPEPVLDGRDFYDPDSPHQGFQDAIDQLADTGGTLRLPGGRYVLHEPLRVPGNVTLAGYGTGTVLLPGLDTANIIRVSGGQNVTLRDFVIEGTWGDDPWRDAAVSAGGQATKVIGIEIRGWEGAGLDLAGKGGEVRDCRLFKTARAGFSSSVTDARFENNSAVRCDVGFSITGKEAVIGNIAAHNRTNGIQVHGGEHTLIAGNSVSYNREDGILVGSRMLGGRSERVVIVGNMLNANNQGGGDHAGIHLDDGTRGTIVQYNVAGDEQLHATQLVGIREGKRSRGNRITHNITATLATRRGHADAPSLVAEGEGSTVRDNWTETLLPSNDSLESIAHQAAERTAGQ